MEKIQWPYCSHSKEIFSSKITLAESYLQKYGAEYTGKASEVEVWMSQDDFYTIECIEKNIWKFKDEYVRVSGVYSPEKPFIVLEFSKKKEGPYEDADPFPYDISNEDFEQEIRGSLGIE